MGFPKQLTEIPLGHASLMVFGADSSFKPLTFCDLFFIEIFGL